MTMHRADVAVVGLGAMGAATLLQLARRGVDCVGIDQYAPPHAHGSSHGETRITRCAVGEGEHYIPLALASHRIWRELEAESGEALYDACGCLILSARGGAALHHGKADFVGRSIAAARASRIPHEVLDPAEVARRFPQIADIGDALAYYEPGGGYVRPERCIAVQLDLARKAGARILRAEVAGLREEGGAVRIASTEGTILAGQAVVAAGPWTPGLLGAPYDPLLSVSRQVLHWFPVDEAAYAPSRFPCIIWMHGDGADDYFYAFPALPGTGLLKAATEQYGVATNPSAVDRAVAPGEAAGFHARHLAGRLRGVGGVPARSAVCLYTVTPDAGFIVDAHPAMPRVTVISACSGHGFKHSAGIGELVAEGIATGRRAEALDAFALARLAA